ncbi:hypothetical protein FACS189461_2200 [Spirochaetia bacterium]|nr:hypothetical protein FACS189461_2200 [Spirochaetia bacterium]
MKALSLACLLALTCCVAPQYDKNQMPVPFVSADDPAVMPVQRTDPWWIERQADKISSITSGQKIILVGDSITHGWEGTEAWDILKKKYDNKITNLGFSGDKTGNVIWRLTNGGFPPGSNPEYVILMIGTNNTDGGDDPKSTAAGIGKIIKIINEASPDTTIIVVSILPRGDKLLRLYNSRVNDIIRNFDSYNNVRYYDLGQFYTDQNGALINAFYSADLLHLSPKGYLLWKDKILDLVGE